MVKANVDKILEVLGQKKSASVGELSKLLNLKPADIQKSAEYLEQDGVVKIEHKFPYVMVTLTKDIVPQVSPSEMPSPPPSMPQTAQAQPSQENMALSQTPHFDVNFKPQETPKPIIQAQHPEMRPMQINAANITIAPAQSPPTPRAPQSNQNSSSQQDSAQARQDQTMQPMTQTISQAPPEGIGAPQFSSSNVEESKSGISVIPNYQNLQGPGDKISEVHQVTENSSEDPLDMHQPSFNLAPPTPGMGGQVSPVFVYNQATTATAAQKQFQIEFPSYLQSDIDRIEFLLDLIEKKADRHDYSNLNDFYRRAYDLFSGSQKLSPNESFLISERLKECFDRVKHVYLVEQAV